MDDWFASGLIMLYCDWYLPKDLKFCLPSAPTNYTDFSVLYKALSIELLSQNFKYGRFGEC